MHGWWVTEREKKEEGRKQGERERRGRGMPVNVFVLYAVYQTYIGAMNENIRRQIAISNPFVFKHISNLKVSQ